MVYRNELYDEIGMLISSIQTQYDKINEIWRQSPDSFNLKKRQVRDLEGASDFLKSIMKYRDLLNDQILSINRQIWEESKITYSYRVKNKNSVEYKIDNYIRTHEDGKIPVIKCLNDLLGFRIVVDYFDRRELTKITGIDGYKIIDSSKKMPDNLEYRATHLYFQDGNECFPWELQIWKSADEKENYLSHEKYKQAYTRWEKVTKEHRK